MFFYNFYHLVTICYVFCLLSTDEILFGFRYFQNLAKYAEEHVEDTEAPLFLRFINLLINDAIYLLDEALNVS